MWSRAGFTARLLRMSQQAVPGKPALAPGFYLHVATASNQPSQQTFDITQNPWYQKYADKMKSLKESDPDLYNDRMEKLKEMYAPSASETSSSFKPDVDGSSVDPPPIDAETEQKIVDSYYQQQTKPKTLNSIMKVELLQDKTAEEIEKIWREYHTKHGKKACVFASIHSDDYAEMFRRLRDFPLFVYPLPRGAGYEFFIQQTNHSSIQFTPLSQYQMHKDNSPSCLTLDHYTDLQKDKGIVLMKGEPDTDVLSVYEAQLLAMQVKIYYGVHSGLKFNLVRRFNNDPNNFNHLDLIQEFEKYKKDSKEFLTECEQK